MNRHTGFFLFTEAASKLFDLMLLNLLFLLGCLPVITVGASLTGMYNALFRFANDEGSIAKDYWRGFRSDFGKSTAGWLLLFLIAAAAVENGWFLSATENLDTWIAILFAVVLFWVFAVGSCLFPLMAKFSNTFWQNFKNALLLSVTHLPKTILMILMNNWVFLLLIWDSSLLGPLGVVILLGAFSVPGYFSALLLKKVFAPYLSD